MAKTIWVGMVDASEAGLESTFFQQKNKINMKLYFAEISFRNRFLLWKQISSQFVDSYLLAGHLGYLVQGRQLPG